MLHMDGRFLWSSDSSSRHPPPETFRPTVWPPPPPPETRVAHQVAIAVAGTYLSILDLVH